MLSAHVAKEVGSIWADLGGIFASVCFCAKSVPHLFRPILAETLPEYSGQKCLSAEIIQPTKAEITRAKYIRAEM